MARPDAFFPGLIAIVVVAFGATSVTSLLRKPAIPPPAAVAAAPPKSPVPAGPSPALVQVMPSPVLRPLGVLAAELTTQPLFDLQTDGTPVLAPIFLAAREQPACASRDLMREACAIMAVLRQHIDPHQVKFVIATLPDWVDSNLQWTFDPLVDAIQMSAAQMGYVLVGKDMVDKDPEPPTTSKAYPWSFPHLHEQTAGSLLFRAVHPDSEDPQYLMVLMVPETLTAGIIAPAFATALDLSLLWDPPAEEAAMNPSTPPHIRHALGILGPTYSGSVHSLTQSLQAAAARHHLPLGRRAWFDVVSGSASSPGNPDLIEADGLVRFRATVRSDTDELSALEQYLGRSNRGWQCGAHVALLVEANTTWGRSLADIFTPKKCDLCMANPADSTEPLPCAAVVSFPLHLSRLRDVVAGEPAAAKGRGGSADTLLDLSEKAQPVDRVPTESPELTAASVEIMMQDLFRAMEDRSTTAIGVFATDKRDHIYLAEEIARRRPNVLPFSIESSDIYLHPDVVGYLRGTLIASTYSLADRTQRLTQPLSGRLAPQQFASSPAHGVFNALATLLDKPAHLVDYSLPKGLGPAPAPQPGVCSTGDDRSCAPPVWISMVGRDEILPLEAIAPTGCRASGPANNTYVMCDTEATEGRTSAAADSSPFLGPRRLFLVAVTGLLGLMLGYQVWVQRRVDALPDSPPPAAGMDGRAWLAALRRALVAMVETPAKTDDIAVENYASMAALRGTTCLIFCWWCKLALIYLGDWLSIRATVLQALFCIVALIVTVHVIAATVRTFFPASSIGTHRLNWHALALGGIFVMSGLALPLWPAFYAVQRSLDFVWLLSAAAFIAFDLAPQQATAALPFSRWRRFPVLLGLAAFVSFSLELSVTKWGSVEALLYVDRTASIWDLVTPAYSIVLFALAVFWWGSWNIRRIELLQLPEYRIGIGRLLVGRARAAGLDPEIFRKPTLPVGLYICLPSLAAIVALWFGRPHVGTIDGHYFSAFLLFGGVLIATMMCHALIHSAHLGDAIVKLLEATGRHPGARLFKRLGAERFSWHVAFRDASRSELEPVLIYIERLIATLPRWSEADYSNLLPTTRAGVDLEAQCRTAIAGLRPNKLDEPTRGTLDDSAWRNFDLLTVTLDEILETQVWQRGVVDAQAPGYLKDAFDDMEYIVFFHTSLVLRDLLARLVSGFTMIIGGLFILVVAHLLSTFEGRVFWLCFDAVALILSVAIALRFLLILERDRVLSSLWRTPAGRVTLFGGLTWRMIGYAAVSMVALFAISFPELAGRAVDWLAPARAVLGE